MLANILTNMSIQWTIYLLHYLLIFVNVSQWKYSHPLVVHVSLSHFGAFLESSLICAKYVHFLK